MPDELYSGEYVVVSLEHEGEPVVGVYLRAEESMVLYVRPDGSVGQAPDDCVGVRRVV